MNLTDGLDGLAAGSSIFAFVAFVVIGFWAFRHPERLRRRRTPSTSPSSRPRWSARCAGFLWWNAAPARIFMGDTGSLAIGAGLAGLALMTNTQLLLPIIGGLFVFETLSVILQVVSFRLFGRRVFRMAPIHHHFELRGLARDHRDHPVLDPGRPVHRARPRHLLRRLHRAARGAAIDWPTRRPWSCRPGRDRARRWPAPWRRRGVAVVVVDDRPDRRRAGLRRRARRRAASRRPTPTALADAAGAASTCVAARARACPTATRCSPLAADRRACPVVSEFDLAAALGRPPDASPSPAPTARPR